MTSMLDDLRRLDAAHARGDISAADLAAAKTRLMESVQDADASPATGASPSKRVGLGPALLLFALILTLSAGTTLLLSQDVMLSLTVAITVLAALTVTVFRQMDR